MTDQTTSTAARQMPTQAEYDANMARWQEADTAARSRAVPSRSAALPSAPAPAPAPAATAAPAYTRPATPAPVDPDVARQAQIDNMVGTLKANGANVSSPVDRRAHASMSFTAGDPQAEVQLLAPAAPGSEGQPLYDDGSIDLQGQVDRQAGDLQALQTRLNDGKYDETTGQFKPTITGDTRTRLERQLTQGKESYEFSLQRLNAIAHQRAQTSTTAQGIQGSATVNSRGEDTTWEAEAVRMAYIDSAPGGQRQAYADKYDRDLQEARSKAILSSLQAARR